MYSNNNAKTKAHPTLSHKQCHDRQSQRKTTRRSRRHLVDNQLSPNSCEVFAMLSLVQESRRSQMKKPSPQTRQRVKKNRRHCHQRHQHQKSMETNLLKEKENTRKSNGQNSSAGNGYILADVNKDATYLI